MSALFTAVWCVITLIKLLLGKGAVIIIPIGVGANLAVAKWWHPESYGLGYLHWFVAGWGTCCFVFIILYRFQRRVKKAVT